MRLEDEDIRKIVKAVAAELDWRRQIEQLADAIIRKQAEQQKRIATAPGNYQSRKKAVDKSPAQQKPEQQSPARQESASHDDAPASEPIADDSQEPKGS